MLACFQAAAKQYGGACECAAEIIYEAWEVPEQSSLCRRFKRAAKEAGLMPEFEKACGGSDASVFAAHGISCLVLATGMHEIHSVREYTTLPEMETMSHVVKSLMIDD